MTWLTAGLGEVTIDDFEFDDAGIIKMRIGLFVDIVTEGYINDLKIVVLSN